LLVKVGDGAGKRISLYTFTYRSWYEPFASPMNASLLFSMSYVVLLYAVLWVMYRRRIFLKV
jgi:predicted acyltransferase